MPRMSDIPPEQRVTARTVALTTNAIKEEYRLYCESIGAKPCTRLREFMETELIEARKSRRQ